MIIRVGLKQGQDYVNKVVKRMVEEGYPVECTHKKDYREDYIPCNHWHGWDDPAYFKENVGDALINGWHSKVALSKLIQVIIEVENDNRISDP